MEELQLLLEGKSVLEAVFPVPFPSLGALLAVKSLREYFRLWRRSLPIWQRVLRVATPMPIPVIFAAGRAATRFYRKYRELSEADKETAIRLQRFVAAASLWAIITLGALLAVAAAVVQLAVDYAGSS